MQLQQDLAKQEARLVRDIFAKAGPLIETIAKKEGYTLILEKNESAVLFAAEPVGRGRRAGATGQGPGQGSGSRGRARLVGAALAGLAVLGLVASSLDLPVTRTRTVSPGSA